MIDQHDEHLAVVECLVERHLGRTGAVERRRQRVDMRLDHADAIAIFLCQFDRDFERGAFAQIVDIGFERQAQARDRGVRVRVRECRSAREDVMRLAVIDLARSADQASILGVARINPVLPAWIVTFWI